MCGVGGWEDSLPHEHARVLGEECPPVQHPCEHLLDPLCVARVPEGAPLGRVGVWATVWVGPDAALDAACAEGAVCKELHCALERDGGGLHLPLEDGYGVEDGEADRVEDKVVDHPWHLVYVDGVDHGAEHDLWVGWLCVCVRCVCVCVCEAWRRRGAHLWHGRSDRLAPEHHEDRVVDVCLGRSHRLEDLEGPGDVPCLPLPVDVGEVLATDRLDPPKHEEGKKYLRGVIDGRVQQHPNIIEG